MNVWIKYITTEASFLPLSLSVWQWLDTLQLSRRECTAKTKPRTEKWKDADKQSMSWQLVFLSSLSFLSVWNGGSLSLILGSSSLLSCHENDLIQWFIGITTKTENEEGEFWQLQLKRREEQRWRGLNVISGKLLTKRNPAASSSSVQNFRKLCSLLWSDRWAGNEGITGNPVIMEISVQLQSNYCRITNEWRTQLWSPFLPKLFFHSPLFHEIRQWVNTIVWCNPFLIPIQELWLDDTWFIPNPFFLCSRNFKRSVRRGNGDTHFLSQILGPTIC